MTLSDSELLAKVAEIEGWPNSGRINEAHGDDTFYVWSRGVDDLVSWNPLANSAQAFDLLVKHKMDLVHQQDENGEWWEVWKHRGDWAAVEVDENPRRAIVKAVAKGE